MNCPTCGQKMPGADVVVLPVNAAAANPTPIVWMNPGTAATAAPFPIWFRNVVMSP